MLFSSKCNARINLRAMVRSISLRLRLGCNRRCVGRQDNTRSSPMRIIDANTLSGFARKTAESTSDFASVVQNLVKDVLDSYRPGLHYMRGPGRPWRAKHQPWLRFDSEAVSPGGQSPSVCAPSRRG